MRYKSRFRLTPRSNNGILRYYSLIGLVSYFNCCLLPEPYLGIYGWTPLHFAAWDSHDEVVQLLLKSGVDLEARTAYGYPGHHCIYLGKRR